MSDQSAPAAGASVGAGEPAKQILQVMDVYFNYGGLRAVDGCSFDVREGSCIGLIGPNGAGKSTMMELIAGSLRLSRGQILLDGSDISRLGRRAVARRGVARTFQMSRELRALPVIENVMIAAPGQIGESILSAVLRRRSWLDQERTLRVEAEQLLDWVGLLGAKLQPAGELSGGQRKLLEVARALMARPRLLLLDEPTAGVYPSVVSAIATRVREVVESGITVLTVAHNMEFLDKVADEVVVMANGRVLVRDTLSGVRRNQDVVTAYLGS